VQIELALSAIEQFHSQLSRDVHGRYRSWEHCFLYFKRDKAHALDEYAIDQLALHLAFYLASWGMYCYGRSIMSRS